MTQLALLTTVNDKAFDPCLRSENYSASMYERETMRAWSFVAKMRSVECCQRSEQFQLSPHC
jgi:hypothetical protein